MARKHYRTKELADLAGVTVRALHHYDSIGLLVPSRRSEGGYRLYTDADVLRLQQILLWRELGMALEQIRRTLDDPGFDLRAALLEQRTRLERVSRDTAAMIRSVDAALATLEASGSERKETTMNPKLLFDGFDPDEHRTEAALRWGHTDAQREASRRTKRYKPDDWKRMKQELDELMARLAAKLKRGVAADSPEATELAELHRLHIDRWFYPCPRAMHVALSEMYTEDPRFAASFDRHADGLADYLSRAIRANAGRG